MNACVADIDPPPIPLKLSPNKVPPRLLPTDRILWRWAASVGDCLNDDPAWQELIRANVPPLPDDVAIVVDQLILRSPKGYRQVVELWYRSSHPREIIAAKLHVSEANMYTCWHVALGHLCGHFENSPLGQLRRLAGIDIDGRLKFVHGVLRGNPRGTS